MPDIFISYSRVDRPFVQDLVKRLRRIYIGDTIWFDESLHGGQFWWTEILSQIKASDIFIYLLSRDSVESEYCLAELEEANRLQKQILPVVIRSRTPIPNELRDIQFVDMSSGVTVDGMTELQAAINALARDIPPSPMPELRPEPTQEPYISPEERKRIQWLRIRRWLLTIGVALATLIVLSLVLNLLLQRNQPFDQVEEARRLLTRTIEVQTEVKQTQAIAAVLNDFATQTQGVVTLTEGAYTDTPTSTYTPSNTPTDDVPATSSAQAAIDAGATQAQATNDALATANAPTNTPLPTETPTETPPPTPTNTPSPTIDVMGIANAQGTRDAEGTQAVVNAQATVNFGATQTALVSTPDMMHSFITTAFPLALLQNAERELFDPDLGHELGQITIFTNRQCIQLSSEEPTCFGYDGLVVDVQPVSLQDYLVCVNKGGCNAAQLIERPSLDNDGKSVVSVTWEMGSEYCRWREMRLLTQVEWIVAAHFINDMGIEISEWVDTIDQTKTIKPPFMIVMGKDSLGSIVYGSRRMDLPSADIGFRCGSDSNSS